MADNKKDFKKHYISRSESRAIAKENSKAIKYYEKRKKRKCNPDEYTTQMTDERNIVEFEDLHTYFFSDAGTVKAVNGVTFSIPAGSTVGVVGESGCGKSVTSLSIMQLVQSPQGQIIEGEIRFNSDKLDKDEEGRKLAYDIAKMPTKEMYNIRGQDITMIFQEPMTSLNPVFTIGYQLDEVSLLHINGADKESAKKRSIEMLELVGIAMPEHVYACYPHQLSGGMRQRVMIAMALCCNPKLIIADEPTTALDVTIQAQILDLLRDVKQKISGSIMLITHDLGVIAEMVDYVVVMYAGRIIEKGTVEDIFDRPLHPYTVGLQKSKPVLNKDVDWLYSIKGQVPNPINMPSHCYFKDRCEHCTGRCDGEYPTLVQVTPTHSVACYLAQSDKEEK